MSLSIDEQFMRLAIDKAKEGVAKGQTPFGACIVKDGQVISCEHNVVWLDTDVTAHGEIHAIRKACQVLGSIDLSGCVIYSTCEPCPMCFTACHWAKISKIVYGASISDARDSGFHELDISNQDMKKSGNSPIEIVPHVLRDENLALFDFWSKHSGHNTY